MLAGLYPAGKTHDATLRHEREIVPSMTCLDRPAEACRFAAAQAERLRLIHTIAVLAQGQIDRFRARVCNGKSEGLPLVVVARDKLRQRTGAISRERAHEAVGAKDEQVERILRAERPVIRQALVGFHGIAARETVEVTPVIDMEGGTGGTLPPRA